MGTGAEPGTPLTHQAVRTRSARRAVPWCIPTRQTRAHVRNPRSRSSTIEWGKLEPTSNSTNKHTQSALTTTMNYVYNVPLPPDLFNSICVFVQLMATAGTVLRLFRTSPWLRRLVSLPGKGRRHTVALCDPAVNLVGQTCVGLNEVRYQKSVFAHQRG